MIQLRNLVKRFGANEVLKGIDLDVQEIGGGLRHRPVRFGQEHPAALHGNFLEEFDRATVFVVGDLLGYDGPRRQRVRAGDGASTGLRRNVGMVFQQFNLWPHMTALGNVTEALRRVRRMAQGPAEEQGRAGWSRSAWPTRPAPIPAQLSGGEQQRVAIARALAMEPHILLFDEPTSRAGPGAGRRGAQGDAQLARDGMTMVVVTHEMGFAAHVADRVVFMDQGRIVAQGPPEEIFQGQQHPRLQQFLQDYLERNAFWTRTGEDPG